MINRDSSLHAEIIDKVSLRMAVGFLIAGISFIYEVIGFFYNPTKTSAIQIIGYLLTIAAVTIILWALFLEIKHKFGGKPHTADEGQSFVIDAMNSSFRVSWIATIAMLTIFMIQENNLVGLSIPLEYYFKFLFGYMLFIASINFIYASRNISDEFDEDSNE